MMLIGILILGLIIYLAYDENSKKYTENVANVQSECYNCGYLVKDDFIYCPKCRVELKEKCRGCGKFINIAWRSCPYCNAHKGE